MTWTLLALLVAPAALPQEIAKWRFQTSLHTHHFDDDPEHIDNIKLLNLEAWRADDWHAGFAWFDNSFGQPSQYLYLGKAWQLGKSEHWYWRLTAGLINGYDEPYDDKIPLNGLGVAPAIVPIVGYQNGWFFSELMLGGTAVVTWSAGIQWGRGRPAD